MNKNEVIVAKAFSKQAKSFDALEKGNKVLENMRERIRLHVISLIPSGSKILELNSGTGIDAVYFAEKGYNVFATDVSPGMINELNSKVKKKGLERQLKTQLLSFNDLVDLKAKNEKFDLIFSNFGGLNCALSLNTIFSHFPRLLRKGGYVCLVIMPPICPWELSYCLKGNLKMGLRRLKSSSVEAHLEGYNFKINYYKPSQVRQAFPKHFKQVNLTGLGSFMPPPYMVNLPQKWPLLFRFLSKLDKSFENIPPFNAWADHFLIVMKYHN